MTTTTRRALVCLVAWLTLGGISAAQNLDASKIYLGTTPCVLLAGAGSPEGSVTASCGTYWDTTNKTVYEKRSGTGNTGWVVTTTGTLATNLAGGSAGSLPYQSGANTTTFLGIGTQYKVLESTGSAPQWVSSLTNVSVTGTGTWNAGAVTSSGGFTSNGSPSGYGGGEFKFGVTTAGQQHAITTNATGSPEMMFDHRGTDNAGLWAWRNGTGAASTRMTLSAAGALVVTGSGSFSGNVSIGGTAVAFSSLYVVGTGTQSGGAYQYGVMVDATQSGTTQSNLYYAGGVVKAGTAVDTWASMRIDNVALGAGATVGTQYGIYIAQPTRGGTANYALYVQDGATRLGGNASVGDGVGEHGVIVNAGAGSYGYVGFQKGAAWRWYLTANSTAETGSDVGSDFHLYSYTDAGGYKRSNLAIDRTNGAFHVRHGVYGTGGVTISVDSLYPLYSYNDSVGVGWTNASPYSGGAMHYMSSGTHYFYSGANWRLSIGLSGLMAGAGYTYDIGSLTYKLRSIHAAELWVETLVAQDVMATIGGRVVVAPTTLLTSDLAAAATVILVKHNQLAGGDRVRLESSGKVEFISIDTGPYGAAPGPYSYTVTRNLDGTGANDWYAGDAVLNTGTTGDGFIDLYSVSGVYSGYGPTIAGNVRNSATYNDVSTAWAIGNLNGLYGYGADTYGVALGKYINDSSWLTIEPTGGVRMWMRTAGSNYERFRLAADGSGFLASTNISWTAAGTATISGWTIGNGLIYSGAGSTAVGLISTIGTIRIFAGADPATNAPFRVYDTGAVVMTSATITGSTLNGVASSAIAGWAHGSDNTYIDGADLYTGTVTAAKIAAGSITANKLYAYPGGQMINADPMLRDFTAWFVEFGTASFVTVTDAPVGTTVFRSGTGTTVVKDARYYPIDPAKTYRVRFYARSASGTNGILYADLQQYRDDQGTTCAGNGGRQPYKPSGAPANVAWVEHSNAWGPADFQDAATCGGGTGVKFVRLDWLLNYGGSAGYMEIAWVRFEEMVTAELIVDGSITGTDIYGSTLSAIKATMGTVEIGSGGYVRQGQTAYDTGTGFWLGDDSGTPKFSIGNSSNSKMTWNGTTLDVTQLRLISTASTAAMYLSSDNIWIGSPFSGGGSHLVSIGYGSVASSESVDIGYHIGFGSKILGPHAGSLWSLGHSGSYWNNAYVLSVYAASVFGGAYSGSALNYLNGTGININAGSERRFLATAYNTDNSRPGMGLDLSNSYRGVGTFSPVISFSSMTANGTYNATYAAIYGVYQGNGYDGNWASGDIVFATSNAGGPVERLRISSTGSTTLGSHFSIASGYGLFLDGGSDTYFIENAANAVSLVTGGTTTATFAGGYVGALYGYMTNGTPGQTKTCAVATFSIAGGIVTSCTSVEEAPDPLADLRAEVARNRTEISELRTIVNQLSIAAFGAAWRQ